MMLYATESWVLVEAAPSSLDLSYPNGSSSSIFTLIVSPFAAKRTVSSLRDIQGLTLNATSTVNPVYSLSFAGAYGGADSL